MESSPPILFDRRYLRKRRARASADFSQADFLLVEAAERAAESLALMARPFPVVVELGSHTGQLAQLLRMRTGTQHYIQCDLSPEMLQQSSGLRIAADEELLPFAENSVDAVVSVLSLHWVNDLPGTLAQIKRILKPDGLFFAMLPGGKTLQELRAVFAQTEEAWFGGTSPRVAPFIDVRDAGALLQRAGFALPVADTETIDVGYEHAFALFEELRNVGEVNMLAARARRYLPWQFFVDIASRYAQQFRDGESITATLELVSMTGWKPADTQQQPAKRGSGKISLGEYFLG
ncbi:MAG: methyltransferase domain-containing protein [Rickettsiales bacterium]